MISSPLRFGEVLLPALDVDLHKFATVACDQFTADVEYWARLDEFVGDSPSALRITYPEIFLNDNRESRTRKIVQNMTDYLDGGVFQSSPVDGVLTQRTTPFSPLRRGLVTAVDLTEYSFGGALSSIRATEGTVAERIPPRVAIRKNCPLELPHVMLLVEDEEGLLVENAFKNRGEKLYDFTLNMGGGHLTGYAAQNVEEILKAAARLTEKSVKKYGSPFLFAVGDGNHSLAAAKAVYEETNGAAARYALTEIVNVYDKGIVFHPIHRLVTVGSPGDFCRYLQSETSAYPLSARLFVDGETYFYRLPANSIEGVRVLQSLIDDYADKTQVDYIHGLKELQSFSVGKNVGVELFAMDKSDLFPYVAANGALPRKTFSMGEGREKRYYLEARKIR